MQPKIDELKVLYYAGDGKYCTIKQVKANILRWKEVINRDTGIYYSKTSTGLWRLHYTIENKIGAIINVVSFEMLVQKPTFRETSTDIIRQTIDGVSRQDPNFYITLVVDKRVNNYTEHVEFRANSSELEASRYIPDSSYD